ncbi:hypothetical protein [Flaviaesturariibacter terrae]
MRFSLFLSRVAFICNLFFLLVLLLQMGVPARSQALVSTILIAGYLLVLLFNPVANLVNGVLLLRRRLRAAMPVWLAVANFIFLLLQVQYILFINGKYPA